MLMSDNLHVSWWYASYLCHHHHPQSYFCCLELLEVVGKNILPKSWFDGDLPWQKANITLNKFEAALVSSCHPATSSSLHSAVKTHSEWLMCTMAWHSGQFLVSEKRHRKWCNIAQNNAKEDLYNLYIYIYFEEKCNHFLVQPKQPSKIKTIQHNSNTPLPKEIEISAIWPLKVSTRPDILETRMSSEGLPFSSWWLSQPIWKILVKNGNLPQFSGWK